MPVSPGRSATAWLRSASSTRARVITRADTIDASTPMARVTPKPRTGPDARKNSRPPASRVVTLESMIALQALVKPAVTTGRRPFDRWAAYSSLARSKTSTLASIAMPIASTNPARPGSVNVAPRATSAPYEMIA
jgi:hypothetical protein